MQFGKDYAILGVKAVKNIEDVFIPIEQHLLEDEKPSLYLRDLAKSRWFIETYPFTLLGDLREVEQSPLHHPEGSVWQHTLLVVDLAAEGRHLSENPRVFMWSALLHDLGKAHTTRMRRGKITAYDHDKHGAVLAAAFLQEFTDDDEFIKKVSRMVRWHMQILFVVKKLPFADIDQMISEVSPGEIALLSLCDRLGRGEMTEEMRLIELENMKHFISKCQQHQN
ncbi:trna nucleotidyltransferase, cc-adding [hydrocarbon metagenome]|uniref:Trna nucleotidyltransferase, cc-adding n=1 Tax=hydrocarbon metagenome TaxID=938273 RepID=A0A0W8E3V6_9ZZZZ